MNSNQSSVRVSSAGKLVLPAFFLAVVLGGANAVSIRFALKELPTFWAAALRISGAAILSWAILLVRKALMPARRVWPGMLLYGFLAFGISWAFIYAGLRTIEAGTAQILMALTPLLTFFFAVLHNQERFRWKGMAGALIAVLGIALSFFEHPKGGAAILPMLSIVAGAACLSESLVVLKRLPPMDPILINAVGLSTGGVFLLMFSRLIGEVWTVPTLLTTWVSVTYVVVLGSVAFFWLLTFVVNKWTASAGAYITVLMPFETVALSAWLTGEKLDAGLLFGGALVLLGVWVGALSGGASERAPESARPAMGEAD